MIKFNVLPSSMTSKQKQTKNVLNFSKCCLQHFSKLRKTILIFSKFKVILENEIQDCGKYF